MSTVAPDTPLKRRRPAHHPVAQGHDKKRKKQQCVAKAAAAAAAAALLEVRHVGIPLFCKATGRPCESIRLEAGRLYAIGRGAGRCDFLLPDPRVSNLHCRILFDGGQRKVFVFHAGSRPNDSFVSRERVGEEREAAPRAALSRVFANGVECRQDSAVALFAGDEVLLVCGGDGKCRSGIRIGFAIRRIVVLDEEEVVSPGSDDPRAVKERFSLPWTTTTTTTTSSSSKRVSASRSTASSPCPSSSSAVYRRAKSLLARCRHILDSADPVSCIRRCPIFLATAVPASLNCNNSSGSRLDLFSKEPATDPGGEPELPNVLPINNSDTICNLPSMRCRLPHPLTHVHPAEKVVSSEIDGKGACVSAHAGNLSQRGNKYHENADRITSNLNRVPPETGPCFNSTTNDENRRSFCPPPGMNFCLNRLESIGQDSFGCSSEISLAELIYPVESIAQIFIATFTCDIAWFLSYCRIPDHLPVTIACHNTDRCWSSSPEQRTLVPYPEFPKLVVVGLAFTNSVWWQDFPHRGFMASLVIDAPSQAYWVVELAKYDFNKAMGYLIASVPGIHSCTPQDTLDLTDFLSVGVLTCCVVLSLENGYIIKYCSRSYCNSSVGAEESYLLSLTVVCLTIYEIATIIGMVQVQEKTWRKK